MPETCEVSRLAEERLAASALVLRDRLRHLAEYPEKRPAIWKEVVWPFCEGGLPALSTKVGGVTLYLHVWSASKDGVSYTSSAGANSERSFTGFLPGVTIEEAKLLAVGETKKYW
jgi:hypothetical protein